MILMRGADAPSRAPRTLWTFNSKEDISQYTTGSDMDIGGNSTVNLDLDENPKHNAKIGRKATGVFWGEMRLDVRPGFEHKMRGGYAGFRNKNRPTVFGDLMDDASLHEYLALRLRLGGDPRTRNSYYVNIQVDSAFNTDLWQHRLYFRRQDSEWEDIFIPFKNFVRTDYGQMSEKQLKMVRERVKTIGISMLGGNSGVAGKYELGIDSIRLVNEEDVTHEPLIPTSESLEDLVCLICSN
ncbi:complex I intermediate-associated protein 30-domain-containing protein [Ephemerocybe angulata]|uniref:Complex I intermediate-associated protein 30-domain-containing protein n=1 Tax=Ephemerocybe angulata TaxID=980116 RepID=A0A8H6I1J8_9AGAR|nr:complex I intermediate-associated protein 30-domain-containing protein [Tulosesus angulatus]